MQRLLRSRIALLSPLALTLACSTPTAPVASTATAQAEQATPAHAAPTQPKLAEATQPASCDGHSSACAAHANADHAAGASCAANGESCGSAHAAEQAAEAPSDPHGQAHATASALTRINASGGICMLSNRYLGERADVPIDVAGKTYHGCCANCAARLATNEEARTAIDPVSGKPIDKATAVLARDASNRVHYFESEWTLAQYSAHL